MIIEGLIRRFPALRALSEATTGSRLTGTLSTALAQVEAEFTEMTRSGRRFSCVAGTTGVAPVQAVPTTATMWSVWNQDPNRSYVIDNVTFFLLSGTAGLGGTIIHIVTPTTATLPTLATGGIVASLSCGGMVSKAMPSTGYAITAPSGATQWGITPGQQGQVNGAASVAIGGSYTADVRGRIIVPPGKLLGLSFIAATGTTPLYIASVTWHEVELDLE